MNFIFDDIQEWAPRLSDVISDLVPQNSKHVRNADLPNIEDTYDAAIAGSDEALVIQATRTWLEEQVIICYHGSRLSTAEIASVRAEGLHALVPWSRQDRLKTILSRHPMWEAASARFGTFLEELANGRFGGREGQAHVTLSRGALLSAFNHYLVNGSEFDAVVAVELPDEDALPLLREGRSPVLFTIAVPGGRALEASERRIAPGERSGLVRHVLQYWATWLLDPEFDAGTQRLDFGFIFYEGVPASWMIGSSVIDEASLLPFYRRRGLSAGVRLGDHGVG